MKQILPIIVWLCLPLLAEAPKPDDLTREFKGEAVAKERTDDEAVQAYSIVLNKLLPRMGIGKIRDRRGDQQTFQQICWRAARPGAEKDRLAVCKAICLKLGKATPKPAREWLIKQLNHIGRDESVETLAALLSDEVASIREQARRALMNNPANSSGTALRDALEKAETVEWRLALINALAYRKAAENIPLLTKYAGDENEDIRTAAIKALVPIGNAKTAAVIAKALEKGSRRTGAAVSDAYLRLADRLAGKNDRSNALAIYRKLLSQNGHLKCAAIIGLGRAGGLTELPLIFEAMEDTDSKIRGAGIAALGLLPAKDVIPRVTDKLKIASPELKVSFIEALSRTNNPALIPSFLSAAEDPQEKVRIEALKAMGKLADARALPAVVRAIGKATGKELEAAKNAVVFIPGEDVVDRLIAEQTNTDTRGRVELLRAVATRRSEKVIPALKGITMGFNPVLRVEGLRLLKNLAREQDLTFLLNILIGTKIQKERKATQEAIIALSRRAKDKQALLVQVLDKYNKSQKSVRISLLGTFGLIGGPEALQVLRKALNEEDPEIKDVALRGLTEWKDATVAPDLINIVRQSDNLVHRVLAFRGYMRIIGLRSERSLKRTIKMYQDGIQAAPRIEEKKLVIAGLGNIAHLKALETVEDYLADTDLQDEAAAAMMKIAESIRWDHGRRATLAMKNIVETVENENLKKRARDTLIKVQQFEDYIQVWLFAGHYQVKGKNDKDLFNTVFPPEILLELEGDLEDQVGRVVLSSVLEDEENIVPNPEKAVKWRPVHTSSDRQKSWYVELNRVIGGGNNRVGYMRTWVHSPSAMKARLEVGSDDGIKAWLNGGLAIAKSVHRGIRPGQDSSEVELKEGWNELVLKITQGGGGWCGAARLRNLDGSHIDGLVINGEPEAVAIAVRAIDVEKPSADQILFAHDIVRTTGADSRTRNLVLKKIIETVPNKELADQARSQLQEMAKTEDFILDWQIAGPYFDGSKRGLELMEVAFPPEQPGHQTGNWRNVALPVDRGRPWLVDLRKMIGGDNRVAFLKTFIKSPTEQKARLELGSDDAIKAWLNGKLVHKKKAIRGIVQAQDRVTVKLQKGINILMLGIYNGGGHWAACARFRKPDGTQLEGLEVGTIEFR